MRQPGPAAIDQLLTEPDITDNTLHQIAHGIDVGRIATEHGVIRRLPADFRRVSADHRRLRYANASNSENSKALRGTEKNGNATALAINALTNSSRT